MLTLGICREILYIAKIFKKSFFFTLAGKDNDAIQVNVTPTEMIDVWYKNQHIWNESMSEDGFFGIESLDTISRIIYCIDRNEPWQDKYYYNESQKTP